MLDYSEIGKRIRAYRKKKQLSQEALAEKVWISTTHMSHIETGNTKLSLAVLVELSKVLDVSTDAILFGEIDKSKSIDKTEKEEILSSCSHEQLSLICDLIKSFKTQI